jgi:C1A family cysteine protease
MNEEEMMQLKKSDFFKVKSLLLAVVMVLLLLPSAFAEPGNVDGQNGVDLRDVVTVLQICAGMNPANVDISGETGGSNGKVGLGEAIFILKELSVEGSLKYIGDLGEPDDYADTLLNFEDSLPDTAGSFEGFVAQLPESFDWRDYNAVTRSEDQGYAKIRASLNNKKRENQGYCGSCWAFAAVAAFESKILIAGGPEYNLSEQQQISCNTENFGCCGGYITASRFWEDQGPILENCTKYGDFYTDDSSCGCSWPHSLCSQVSCDEFSTCEELSYRVKNYHSVSISSADEAKISVIQYGPGVFRYDVYDDFLKFWENGSNGEVYVQSSSTKLGGHAVAIIGYDDQKGAWLCKNSWGEDGPNGDGTFWIDYTGHKNDLKFRMSNFSISGVQPCEYGIYPSGQTFASSGGTGSISITATSGCTWTASDDTDWITINSDSSGTGDGALDYSVDSNPDTNSRTGIINAAGKTFSITQSGLSCSFSISPESRSFDASGGTGSVSVTAPDGCQWSAESSESWLTVVSGSSKIGSGVVNYQVASNFSADSRTGTMTIAEQTFTITQTGKSCSYSISPESKSVSPSGETGDVTITTADGCEWTAESNVPWISVTSGSNGDGSGTVSYSVSENSTSNSLTGTITIAGKTFTITQDALSCSYTISPATMFFDLSGGTGSISVIAPSGCDWTVAESLEWVTITAGESGDGDGAVSYSVSENTGADSRTGTMTIEGNTFTITQNGSASSGYTHPIPDTGQDRCYDTNGVEVDCTGTGQDGEYSINPISYTKLDASGNPLPDSADSWSTVRDNVTGLVWEVKESYEDSTTYGWYDPNPTTNGGHPGCEAGRDTLKFITELNDSNYGGYPDWRMPTREELRSIVNYGKYSLAADISYFPYTANSSYWSASSYANGSGYAWKVNFKDGEDWTGNVPSYDKCSGYYARAVRGGQARSFDNWIINGDGTVTDPQTGLMWELKTDDGGDRDKDNKYTWQEALDYCNNLDLGGYSDWRLPSINELTSLVDLSRYDPPVNTAYFPKTVTSYYWSSTSCAHPTYNAWRVAFKSGTSSNGSKSSSYYVRAVRGGVNKK